MAETAGEAPLATQPRDSSRPGFLVGPENQLAHEAVASMARGEDEAARFLVLRGASGTGKSLLLRRLASEWLARRPVSRVGHLSGEAFASRCRDARDRRGGWSELRGWLRALELLVIDDLEAAEQFPPALEEFDHALDDLLRGGASVAIGLRGIRRKRPWPARLLDRLSGGVQVRLRAPGVALRRRFVMERLRGSGLSLSIDAIDWLAHSAREFRVIEGWMTRLEFWARMRMPSEQVRVVERADVVGLLSADLAVEGAESEVGIDAILRCVAREWRVRTSELRGTARDRTLVIPRHLAIYLAREITSASFARIGGHFGNRDAKTIRHACRVTKLRLERDATLGARARRIAEALGMDGEIA